MGLDPVEQLVAAEQIRALKTRYFRFVDTHDWDGLATLFCEDAVFDTTDRPGIADLILEGGEVSRGRDAILAYLVGGMSGSVSVHHGHGHEITFDSATEAHGVIAMEDRVEWPGPPRFALHGFGHYRERYRFEDGDWRILHSKLTRIRVLKGF